MRFPPLGYSSTDAWARFDRLCDEQGVGRATELWMPLWQFFIEGHAQGISDNQAEFDDCEPEKVDDGDVEGT